MRPLHLRQGQDVEAATAVVQGRRNLRLGYPGHRRVGGNDDVGILDILVLKGRKLRNEINFGHVRRDEREASKLPSQRN